MKPMRDQGSGVRDQGEDKLPVRSYRDLKVWQRAKNLAVSVYGLTKIFPKDELYGLTSQIRRAAVSVPSNIAEGQGRSTRDYLRFIDIAYGSLSELETQLEIALDLQYVSEDNLRPLLADTEEIGKMLNGLSQSLKAKLP